MKSQTLKIGKVSVTPDVEDGILRSIGELSVNGVQLRNGGTRFLPWFDTYEGDIFRTFKFLGIETDGDVTVIKTRAVSDPDTMFRERRDSSGDLCFRNESWDADPIEADFNIMLEPVTARIDGREFTGLKYWFEYKSDRTPIHRLIDRQTWEVGGNLDDVTICIRNWLTPPRMKVGLDSTYSTVGLDKWASLLPGNMWGRWSLLPAYDFQYGDDGVIIGWFDEVSNIRTAIETNAGEDWLRHIDMHMFANSTSAVTNPKTILYSPDVLDDVDAVNLWTRVYDQEHDKACKQFGMQEEEPPCITFSYNQWKDFRFDTTYEQVVEVASEFGADYVFIDPIWEHQQAYQEYLAELIPREKWKGTILEKVWHQNMCVTLDFEVAEVLGGEAGLKALCDRARDKGVKIISWMATHYSPNAAIHQDKALAHGAMGIYAAKESGRHPDTGYAASCWAVNLNGPVADKIKKQIMGVCERTGLAGYLWDSYSNLGWWHVDYSDGSLRPQFDKQAQLYADLANAGLYIQPEGMVAFSNHSCVGMHGGDIYKEQPEYSYNTVVGFKKSEEREMLKGTMPIDMLFQAIANKRVPSIHLHDIPKEERSPEAEAAMKELFRAYKQNRHLMKKRTVLKENAGVLWQNDTDEAVFFCLSDHERDGEFVDAGTGEQVSGTLKRNRVYATANAASFGV